MKVELNESERIDQLYSQKIKVIQNPNVFSFSLDAILLANFAAIPKSVNTRVVDLCAGNGAVGLFAAHKTNGQFSEVEIQPKLADMAQRSVDLNDLSDRFTVYNTDIKDVYNYINHDSTDVVICNPPYFANSENSHKNSNQYLAIARHEIKTNLNMVLSITSGLLKTNGRCYFVYRPDRLLELLDKMSLNRLVPKEIQFIYPRIDRDANMILVSGIKDGRPGGLKVKAPITVYQGHGNQYTEQISRVLYGK
ncbi:tRNA1(Val) (adenine(37)-N6)-methyltransferase [Nicoliella spurrieriana]|uniref:tRNA1(Val) (Adenine(37)-N6)-methyltransferase n=1 Tax=Nicoliella spurrieriana TaxID=2925830 RepID=A0A976X5Z0_9LACO|nr:tRNA1(Val) (adenine(37)-N6)-methyltransferase [Nicoliella spurrieriana]UQS87508.1 tRNA1(Val) (adenine(37)-N6)-methyltransferase [Nicoliella spurrieriana]